MTQLQAGAAILLDLDGTLTDSREGILGCLKHALARVGAVIPADEKLEAFIGPPLHETFTQLLGVDRAARLPDAIGAFRERFTAKGMFENRIYPGITRVLTELQDTGVSLIVATSKPQPFAERILEHFDLRKFFHGVHGSELDGTRSRKSELISHILRREALSAFDTAMVGDRALDVIGAKANGVFSIGVLWGYGSREELETAGADALCEQPGRLADTVSFNYPFNPTRPHA